MDPIYKGKEVAVFGGGNSAGEESLLLTRFVDKVTILVRGEAMSTSKIVTQKVSESPKIEVRTMGLQTSVPGVFAAGDVRFGSVKQAASAVGEGATAPS